MNWLHPKAQMEQNIIFWVLKYVCVHACICVWVCVLHSSEQIYVDPQTYKSCGFLHYSKNTYYFLGYAVIVQTLLHACSESSNTLFGRPDHMSAIILCSPHTICQKPRLASIHCVPGQASALGFSCLSFPSARTTTVCHYAYFRFSAC